MRFTSDVEYQHQLYLARIIDQLLSCAKPVSESFHESWVGILMNKNPVFGRQMLALGLSCACSKRLWLRFDSRLGLFIPLYRPTTTTNRTVVQDRNTWLWCRVSRVSGVMTWVAVDCRLLTDQSIIIRFEPVVMETLRTLNSLLIHSGTFWLSVTSSP